MIRILVVDDDPFSRRFLEGTLRDAGWDLIAAADGEAGWEAWTSARPRFDVVVCDVRMPRLNGYELIGRIREHDAVVPIIAVSAMGADDQIVVGLEAGADDYLVKPVASPVLIAKVRAALRRREQSPTDGREGCLVVGALELDVAKGEITRAGEAISLTRTELALMAYLMQHPGRIVSPAQILSTVWGDAYEDENEILRTTVLRIRRKLELDPSHPRFLRTHVGMGYSLVG